jgi:hypothetical protein
MSRPLKNSCRRRQADRRHLPLLPQLQHRLTLPSLAIISVCFIEFWGITALGFFIGAFSATLHT